MTAIDAANLKHFGVAEKVANGDGASGLVHIGSIEQDGNNFHNPGYSNGSKFGSKVHPRFHSKLLK